jgi:hypothetical protein
MNTDKSDPLARSVATLLIAVAVGTAVGHVLTVERVYEPSLSRAAGEVSSPYPAWPAKRPMPTPLLRSNDRSRWCTIRALVDEGTYIIGHRDPARAGPDNRYGDSGIVFEDGWTSVDKVLRPGTGDFYSSKPPMLPTLMAGEYWLLERTFGWTLAGDAPSRWWVVRVILLTFNVLPLAIYLILLDRLAAWLGATDWGRVFVLVTACFGTFVTPFMGALNNHTVATCAIVFALAPALRAVFGRPEDDRGWRYAVAGFFAAFAACNDLPAASFAVALLAILLVHSPRKTLLCAVPAAAILVVAFFVCNYRAIGQLTPAYGELGGAWYAYPGSNFNPKAESELRRGVDWAREKETHAMYLFHSFFGHHGIFSLTPVWVLSVVGLLIAMLRGRSTPTVAPDPGGGVWSRIGAWRVLAGLTLLISVVVVGFYLVLAPIILEQRNYGGWTLGPRWLMWLTPLWLLVLLPAADRFGRSRLGRAVASVLLALSVLSATVPDGIPWHHPWIYTILEQMHGPMY